MSLPVFQRAASKILARLGEVSSLQGVSIGPVNLERDVEVFAGNPSTSDDNPVIRVIVATMPRSADPRAEQVLVHPDGSFTLDRLLDDNGYNVRFVVRPIL